MSNVFIIPNIKFYPSIFSLICPPYNQLEKLEAARSAYLWLLFLIFSYLSWPEPYWALLDLTRPYWVLLGLILHLHTD